MSVALSPIAEAAGHRLAAFDTIGSTSQEAMRRAAAGDPGPLWVVARTQTEGAGRRGSRWETPEGNLAASLLLVTDLPPAKLATLGFVAGLALDRALAACCGPSYESGITLDEARSGRDRFRLKWPNDMLADGAKLAGILLGTEASPDGRRAVVIGIGVNVAAVPGGLPSGATSLRALGFDATADALFTALTGAWVELFGLWRGGDGFDAIRELWLERATGLGGDVAVRTAAGVARGIFETIDGLGQLVIRLPDKTTRLVTAGDVHFGLAATARAEAAA